jgi:hypothetical protein
MQKLTLAALAAIAVAMSLAVVPALTTEAFAKIREVPISCENPAGQEPGGQQPRCKNENLTQESENQNPSGHAPPGHN